MDGGAFGGAALIANKQAARPLGRGITPWGGKERLALWVCQPHRKEGLADVPLSDVLLKLM